MNYQSTIDFLFSRLPMFSRTGASAYKPGLGHITELCDYLGRPQNRFKSIHIAGTNGKGSTSHILAAVLQEAGYKTGLYTSPHLRDFRERIKVNGEWIAEDFVVDFTEGLLPLIDEMKPSFFEITVAMAFQWFARQEVDVAVIEVGLGGRLDSTNIIVPELSVITNIGLDHVALLGDTLELIAGEKAGIIKPGVPVVIGETLPETRPVFERVAAENKAPIRFAREHLQATDWRWEKGELLVEIARSHHQDHQLYHLDLPGIYQTRNLVTALEAIAVLREAGWQLEEAVVKKALRQVKKLTGLHGRWEQVHQHPAVVLDVAHNEDGMRQLIMQLESTTYNQLYIVLGMVRDKDIDRVLSLLPAHAHFYFTRAAIPRALPAEELMEKAGKFGLQGQCLPDVNAAIRAALEKAAPDDLVLVCGSVFLVGEVRLNN